MGKIGTKEVKVGGGSLPKTFIPGNHTCKINSISLDRPKYAKDGEEMYSILMDLETEPIEGFEGFFIDSNNESLGRYTGQIGRVKSSQYAYKDSEWKGKSYSMIDEIIKFLKSLCIELKSDWMDDADGKYDTIEEMVDAFNKQAPFKGVFLSWCIGAQQIEGDNGYPKYFMYLPKYKAGFKLFTAVGDSSLLPYDKALHLDVKGQAPATVQGFGTDTNEDPLFAEVADDNDDPFAVDTDDEDPFAV